MDHFWESLSQGGDEKAQQCGWLKDRYGVSWQIVLAVLVEMITDPDPGKSQRAMTAMLQMKKIDIGKLRAGVRRLAAVRQAIGGHTRGLAPQGQLTRTASP